jgi:hypothetical protein
MVKGGGRAPTHSPGWADFTIMIESTPESDHCHSVCTVLRPRIICLKKVHPGKWARAQELYIVSSYTYAFNETFMRMDISLVRFIRVAGGTFRWWIYPEKSPRLPPDIQMIEMFFKPASHWLASRALIGRYGPWLGNTRRGDQRKFFFTFELGFHHFWLLTKY